MARTRVPMLATDRQWLVDAANTGMSYRDMATGIDRSLGTIKTAMFNLRNAGLVSRRYTDWNANEL